VTLSFGQMLKPLFGVSDKEARSFSEEDQGAALRLETVIRLVTKGCQITLQSSNFAVLVPRLDEGDPELRGFLYEGAGIGLAALDCLMPWKNRIKDFLNGPGSTYIYAVPLGAGMGLARLRRNPERFMRRLDPVLGWIIIDGYGFHEGFFARKRYIEKQEVPKHLSAYARRVFDHGLGRAIWFVRSTNVERVAATIASFPTKRQADLWSGIGLACGYTGGVNHAAVEALQVAAGPYKHHLALGAAIAANARHEVGNPSPHAERACEVLWGLPSETVSQMTDAARENLPVDGDEPAYEIWRQRLVAQSIACTTSDISSETRPVQ
jgi:enediyne biosynthesis protein E3